MLHRHSHKPPATIAPNAHGGIEGIIAIAPGLAATEWASHSSTPIALPVSHQKGWPTPTESSSRAPPSSGMITKVVSGIAITFAPTP